MGADGGTIASRDLIVSTQKRKVISQDIRIVNHGRYTNCALSGLPLHPPLMVCELGYIYNKEKVINFLISSISYKKDPNSIEPIQRAVLDELQLKFPHLQKLADLTPANAETTLLAQKDKIDSQLYLKCPILSIWADGNQPFLCMRECGCILSQKGYEQLHGDKYAVALDPSTKIKVLACCVCQKPLSQRFQATSTSSTPIAPIEGEKTKKSSAGNLPLQPNEKPYINLIPLDNDYEILLAILNAKRILMGRNTVAAETTILKKRKIELELASTKPLPGQRNGDELVQLDNDVTTRETLKDAKS